MENNWEAYRSTRAEAKLISHKRAILEQAKFIAMELGDEGLVISLNLLDEKLARQYWEVKAKHIEILEASAR